MATTPEVRLDEDGRHFLFSHECVNPDGWFPDERLPLGPPLGWIVESTDPLTVSPSINCLNCGTHGWWRDGQWVGA